MSVDFEIEETLDDVMPDKGVVGEIKYTAPYALYVEFDTAYTDSNIPYEPLREWVEREWGNLPSSMKKMAEKQLESRNNPNPSTEEIKKQVTWIVIEGIKKSGIEGVHFGKRAMEHGKSKEEMVANIHKERENPYQNMARNLVEIMFEHSQGTIEEEAKSSGQLKESGEWDVRKTEDED